jgi:hypothetical protein
VACVFRGLWGAGLDCAVEVGWGGDGDRYRRVVAADRRHVDGGDGLGGAGARGVRVAGERSGWGYFGLCGGGGARWQRRWSEFGRSSREENEHVFASSFFD